MKYPKLSLLFLAFSLLIFTSCDKDDDSPDPDLNNFAFVQGPEGSSFTITTRGKSESCEGTNVIGWDKGMLLSGNYRRQVRADCNNYTFALRFNIPKDSIFDDIVEGEHDLYNRQFLLEYSGGQMTRVFHEFFVFYSKPDAPEILDRASGTVKVRKDVQVLNSSYVVVDVDATFYDGLFPVEVKGVFWSKNLEW